MSSLSLHTLSLSLSLLTPQRARGRAQEPRRQQRNNSFPPSLYSRAISFIYLSVIRGTRDGATEQHTDSTLRTRKSYDPRSRPDPPERALLTSRRGPLSLSFSLLPHVSMQIPQAKGPDYTCSTQRILSLQRTQQPTQQEVRRVEEEEREKKYTRRGGRGGQRRNRRSNRLTEQTADKPGCTGEKREGGSSRNWC